VTFEERQRLAATRSSPLRDRPSSPPTGSERRWGADGGARPAVSGGSGGAPSERAASPARPAAGIGGSADRPSGTSSSAAAVGGAAAAAADAPSAPAAAADKGWGAQAGWGTPLDKAADAGAAGASGGGAANGAWQSPASDVWGSSAGQHNGWRDAQAAGASPRTNGAAHGLGQAADQAPSYAATVPAPASALSPGVDPRQKIWYYVDPKVRLCSGSEYCILPQRRLLCTIVLLLKL